MADVKWRNAELHLSGTGTGTGTLHRIPVSRFPIPATMIDTNAYIGALSLSPHPAP